MERLKAALAKAEQSSGQLQQLADDEAKALKDALAEIERLRAAVDSATKAAEHAVKELDVVGTQTDHWDVVDAAVAGDLMEKLKQMTAEASSLIDERCLLLARPRCYN